ncbi:fungal protein [Schizosaccharomyces japonicus yFS275]|uniref:Fungal protein n=1 Tax=Schizosaccharomyces japonicus (strain yFS275 / FY16936) TaxID=402676 RepID=B6K459_SCHJY|nr:fungal protein [Schizosaccharomyces japonicus yFS275]EEB08266.1 fungal protein [Schizosaccharomyces japonicus yFS275]
MAKRLKPHGESKKSDGQKSIVELLALTKSSFGIQEHNPELKKEQLKHRQTQKKKLNKLRQRKLTPNVLIHRTKREKTNLRADKSKHLPLTKIPGNLKKLRDQRRRQQKLELSIFKKSPKDKNKETEYTEDISLEGDNVTVESQPFKTSSKFEDVKKQSPRTSPNIAAHEVKTDIPIKSSQETKVSSTHPSPENDDDLESEDSEPVFTPRARLKKHRKLVRDEDINIDFDEEVRREAEELDDVDLEVTGARIRNPKKQLLLQKLKQLRGRKHSPVLNDSDTDEETDNKESTSELSESQHSDSDSFVVDDAEDLTEVQASLPVEFSSSSYQGLKFHFRNCIKIMVYRSMDQSYSLDSNEHLAFSLHTVRRRMASVVDSTITSSAWRSDFLEQLKTRPMMRSKKCEPVMGCSACHIQTRVSTHCVRFTGSLYDKNTYQSISKKRKDVPEAKDLPIGVFCFRRARMAHNAFHWEYRAYQHVEAEVSQARKKLSTNDYDNLDDVVAYVFDTCIDEKFIESQWTEYSRLLQCNSNFFESFTKQKKR